MLVIEARLGPEQGALFEKALDAACDRQRRESVSAETSAARRADALAGMAETSLGGGPERSSERYLVTVHVDAAVLADPRAEGRSHIEDGPAVSAETARRLACGSPIVTMVHDAAGKTLDVGRKTRRFSPALCRALRARDGGCRFPSCTNRFIERHHVIHWLDGGPTSLPNTAQLCAYHHRLVHEEGFTVRAEEGSFRFFDPRGREILPGRARVEEGVDELRRRELADDILIDARTAFPTWDGTPVDYAGGVQQLIEADRRGGLVRPVAARAIRHPEADHARLAKGLAEA